MLSAMDDIAHQGFMFFGALAADWLHLRPRSYLDRVRLKSSTLAALGAAAYSGSPHHLFVYVDGGMQEVDCQTYFF